MTLSPATTWPLGSGATLAMVLLGGQGTLAGPIVGAFVITGLAEGMREVMLRLGIEVPGVKQVFYGICLLLVVMFLPDGVWPPLAKKLGLRR